MKNTFDFDFKKGEFLMKNRNPIELSGIDALKLWIEKCIRTQLGRYSIYAGTRYGANIEDLAIGKSYRIDFAESELRRELEEALLQNGDIHRMESFSTEKRGSELIVRFTLLTVYGEVREEYAYDA